MAQLIFKCPYLKGGGANASHLTHLTNYIATRDGVEFLTAENKNLPATKKQEEFISQLLKDFPSSKNIFEYEDYLENKTIANASEFISMALEYNIDRVAKKENYVDYIATRPLVEKISSHGLFTAGNDEIVLSQVVSEIANHNGNVWLPIIALKGEDAKRSGFDNLESWKLMLEQYALEIAKNLKIPDSNFRWYAAFHHHKNPHIHMVCYSANPKEGYLSKTGIKNIKSGLMQNIYGSELQMIYAEKTIKRDELKAESKKAVEQLMQSIVSGNIQTEGIEKLVVELSENLKYTNGKRVYGYLPPRIKKLVDEITDELCKQPSVSKAYNLWYKLQDEVVGNYTDKDIPKLPLSKQKEFKSIKNHIIYEADKLSKGEISLTELDDVDESEQEFICKDENTADVFDEPLYSDEEIPAEKYSSPFVDWTDEYRQARAYLFGDENNEPDFAKALELLQAESEKGNLLAVFDLGRMYADGLGVEIDTDKAQEYYALALDGFEALEIQKPWKYLEYRIGKMYAQGLGTEQDYELAAEWFTKSASQKYKFAEYSLGGLYYRGQGVQQSFQKAFELYLRSAKQGFPYADFDVAKMFRDGIGTEKNEEQSHCHFEKAFIGFEALEQQSHDDKIQYRLGWMLQNGIGTEQDMPRAKEYFEKSAELGNTFACYSLAKLILGEDEPTTEELKKALSYLHTASDSGNEFAQYSLAKFYYKGEHLEQDITKAVELFTLSAEQNNEWAAYSLGKIYLTEDSYKDIDKAVHWLKKSADENNQFAEYQLGKLYLQGDGVPQDISKAVEYLTAAAEQKNQYAEYQLGKLYLQGEQISKHVEKAIHYLNSSAEQGNQFSQYVLGKLYLMGKEVEKDKETAIKWFTLSAQQGNEYAQFFLDNMDKWRDPSVSSAAIRLLHHMSKIFEDKHPQLPKQTMDMKIDSKRLRKLREKKLAAGQKLDDHSPQMYTY